MIDEYIRALVRERAGDRCEYCRLPHTHAPWLVFQIDHIIARQHRGSDEFTNLALICPRCNLHKGTNVGGIDPDTNKLTRLFHPREDDWTQHFEFKGTRFAGRSPIGRTTVWVLAMNHQEQLQIRQEIMEMGDWD